MTSGAIPEDFSGARRRPRLAVLRGVVQGSFFERYLQGVQAMASELGMETLVFDAPGASIAGGLQAVVGANVDAVLVSTGSMVELTPGIDAALARGAKVVAFDVVGEHPRVPALEQDDMWIGFLLSRKLASDCDGKAEVIYLNPGGFAPLVKRDRSWQDFKWRYPGLREVVRAGAVTEHTEADTEALFGQLLERHPEATAVLATWDEFARGAVRAIRRAGLEKRVRVYSADIGDQDLAMMCEPDSPWVATVATDAFNIGRVAVRAAAALIAGEHIDRFLLVEPQLITQEYVQGNGLDTIEKLVAVMPTLRESRLLWFDWMEPLLERAGHPKNIAALAPEQLIDLSRQLGQANAALREEIAERARVEEKLRFTNLVLRTQQESSPDGVLVVDAAGHTLSFNRRFLSMWGLSQEPVVLGGDEALLEQAQRQLVDPVAFRARIREIYGDHERLVHDELELVGGRWLERISAPMFGASGQYQGRVWYFRDITEQKRATQALYEADRRKDEFLAMLSHELRNPLAPIRINLALLTRVPPGSSSAMRALAVLDRQSAHLVGLVDDLLDVTRIARGKLQLKAERVELVQLVRRVAEDFSSTLDGKELRIETALPEEPMWLSADPLRITQIVGNLLSNAAKFAASGGRVELSLEREAEQAVLRVRDYGAGIAPGLLSKIFEPFYQANHTLERTRGGLGLGLPLVKALTEMHGGAVLATSEGRGRGAEFTVRLPLESRAPTVTSLEMPGAAPPPRPRRVLVIEDNVDAAESLKELLELEGHEAHVALDGPSGLAAARTFHPEIIFCDIGLPGMDGYALAAEVRADASLRGTKLVALTGYALPEDRLRAQAAGFDTYVTKPPSIEILQQILGEA